MTTHDTKYKSRGTNPQTKKRFVIWDIGGVLIDFQEAYYYRDLAKLSGLEKGFIEKKLDPLVDRLDLGKLRVDDFERTAAKILSIRKKDIRWLDYFKENSPIIDGVINIAQNMPKDIHQGILTNNDKSRHRYTTKVLTQLADFENIFTSSHIHLRKPDPGIYRYMLRKLDAKPAEVVFVDDKERNVHGARRVGIDAIKYENPELLVKELEKRSIHLRR